MGNSKHVPTLEDIKAAAKRLKNVAVRTPLISLRWYDEDPNILLKPEILQPVGSYKIRGVYNWAMSLPPEERAKGISTVSSGNMAIALAYVGKLLGIPARGVMFDYTPKSKIEAFKKYGGEVVLLNYEDAFNYADNPQEDRCFLHPLEEFKLMEGHGTIGLEIIEDAPQTDTIYVAVGAGFLGGGTAIAAKALKPSVKVIGVNSDAYPHFYESYKQKRPVQVEHQHTLADSISAPKTREDSLRLLQGIFDDVVLVSEDMIKDAIRYLATENKMYAEGAAAATLAAALNEEKEKRGNSVCILSGGSIDPEKMAEILLCT
jgi:threonine dehydratase